MMLPSLELATHALSRSRATPSGFTPTGISATNLFEAGSITPTEFEGDGREPAGVGGQEESSKRSDQDEGEKRGEQGEDRAYGTAMRIGPLDRA